MHFLAPSKKDIIMLAECVLSIPEFNWNQRFRDKTTLKICRQVLASSTQRQNRSFHVGGQTRTAMKCARMKNAHAKRAKVLGFFSLLNMQICDVLVSCRCRSNSQSHDKRRSQKKCTSQSSCTYFLSCVISLIILLVFQAFYIWVGRDAPIDVIQSLFAVPNFGSIPDNLVSVSTGFVSRTRCHPRWDFVGSQLRIDLFSEYLVLTFSQKLIPPNSSLTQLLKLTYSTLHDFGSRPKTRGVAEGTMERVTRKQRM